MFVVRTTVRVRRLRGVRIGDAIARIEPCSGTSVSREDDEIKARTCQRAMIFLQTWGRFGGRRPYSLYGENGRFRPQER